MARVRDDVHGDSANRRVAGGRIGETFWSADNLIRIRSGLSGGKPGLCFARVMKLPECERQRMFKPH